MEKSLKIIFMGTPDFAVESLKMINQSQHKVVGVITSVDKPAGRGKKLHQSAVKKYALANDLKILQPPNLKSQEFVDSLKSIDADLFVVVAFRMLPKIVWSMPTMGTINLHGSLLPDYRGAAPINWAVINGDDKTGVSTFYINEKIDTGEILMQKELPIGKNDTAGIVHDQMMMLGAHTLLETINRISEGNITSSKQKWEESYRKAPKIFKEDCRINWSQQSTTIFNIIRGLSPYPTAYTVLEDEAGNRKNLKVFFAEQTNDEDLSVGEIRFIGRKTMLIGTADSAISVQELQLEGKKRMNIKDFLSGFKTEIGWKAL